MTYKKIDFPQKNMLAVMGTGAKEIGESRNWNTSSDNIDEMMLIMRLNTNCNFDCKYCSLHDTQKFIQNPNIIKDYLKIFIDNIHSKYKETGNYKIIGYYLYGGEPTQYKHLIEVITFIHNYHNKLDHAYTIEIQTNLTKPISFFKKLKKANFNIKFVCSYQNTEQQKLINYQEKYKKTSKYLIENDLTIGFDIMLEDPEAIYYKNENVLPKPEDLRDLYTFYKLILDEGIYNNFGIQMNTISNESIPKVYEDLYNDCSDVTEKLKIAYLDPKDSKIKQDIFLYNDLISYGFNNFFGYNCEASKRQYLIQFSEPEIKLYRCFSETFYDAKNTIFNSRTDDINTFNDIINKHHKIIKCLFTKCSCEISLKKYKSKKYKNLLDSGLENDNF